MSADLFIKQDFDHKKVVYLIKEQLKEKKQIKIISSYLGSMSLAKSCNILESMNYVTIVDIQTLTDIRNDKRNISMHAVLEKTSEFDKLYEEAQEKKKEYLKNKENNEGGENFRQGGWRNDQIEQK